MDTAKYLFVRVLEACNADCFMCGFALSRDGYRLGADELAAILRQTAAMGVQYLRFTGGEPLMHREITSLVRVGSQMSTQVSLITNGFLLPRMAAELAEAGLSQVVVSIDSAFAEQHDEYRNTLGLFDKAFAGMAEARRHSILIRVNTVVGPHNYQAMPALGRILKDAGVSHWELSALKLSSKISYVDRADVLRVGKEVYAGPGLMPMGKKWYGDTPEEQDRYFELGIPPRPSGPVCRVTDDVMYLDPKSGYLFPCSLLPHRSAPALHGGHVLADDGTFVLNSSQFEERRLFFRQNGPSICTGCSSSAAGYSDFQTEAGEPRPAWSY